VFLISKIALQETAGQQRPADQDHEEDQVFAEEVPWADADSIVLTSHQSAIAAPARTARRATPARVMVT
jgi:hypothetical protein